MRAPIMICGRDVPIEAKGPRRLVKRPKVRGLLALYTEFGVANSGCLNGRLLKSARSVPFRRSPKKNQLLDTVNCTQLIPGDSKVFLPRVQRGWLRSPCECQT